MCFIIFFIREIERTRSRREKGVRLADASLEIESRRRTRREWICSPAFFLSLSLSLCLTVGSWRFRVGIELAPRYYTPCFTRANNFCEKFYQRVEGFFVCELAARLKIMSCLLFWKCDGCLILSVMRMVYIPKTLFAALSMRDILDHGSWF